MKILWITNILLSEASKYLNRDKLVVGGWMDSLLQSLKGEKNLTLGVASVYNGTEFISFEQDEVRYFLIPLKGKTTKYNTSIELYWKKINTLFTPTVVHIHGTEHAHGLAMINSCPDVQYVLSIQGLVSVYERYFYSGINIQEFLSSSTIKDVFRGSVFGGKRDYKRRGLLEKEYITKVENIIGRTEWDKAHTYFINKKRNYFFCNESLRAAFYKSKYQWKIDNVVRYSIFLSQANYPIKGLHYLLKAVALIKDEFPNVKIYVGGEDIISTKPFSRRVKRNGYAKYILKLISDLELKNHICFMGLLDEIEMAKRYQKSHVFVCPSSIENSPNSLAEAQVIGVPAIASYVGGVPNMINHRSSGLLYPFGEYEMLASYLIQLFKDDNLSQSISSKSIKKARKRHDVESNKLRTIEIYESITKL